MGIESDQLVFDYLSRVGDLAQRRQLPSGERMRLVSSLRGEIDRRRATDGRESPAAVRTLLDELGSPDEVVDRAAGGGREEPRVRTVPEPRTGTGPTPPHLAGTDEVGAADTEPDTEPDWWRLDGEPDESLPGDDLVPGFRGGVEIPEILKPPPGEAEAEKERAAPTQEAAARVPLWRRVLRRGGRPEAEAGGGGGFRLGAPVLVLAALLLLGGVVFGNLVALALGWLLAYASRRLSPTGTRVAVVVLPGLAVTAGAVWLWGRVEGRWGEPVAKGGEAMGAALSETWPWTLKAAALATAAYLLWQSRRTP